MCKYKFLRVGQLITKYLKPMATYAFEWIIVAHVASIIVDIKIYQCHIKRQWRCYPQWRSALSPSITELLLLPNFDDSSPSVTRDKEICHMIMS